VPLSNLRGLRLTSILLTVCSLLVFGVSLLMLSGCGDDIFDTVCEQDVPVSQDSTFTTPYTIGYYTTNFDIRAVRWVNRTTGGSGSAQIVQVDANWLSVHMEIPLASGLNNISVYEDDGDCEWREDYLVTLN